MPGFDQVEWLVVDDGSTDETAAVARANGVDHVVRHTWNLGLGRAFMTGLDACLERGADVIVNTDADNQYDARDIPALTAPILEQRADMVVGTRPIATIEHFSGRQEVLQRLGSWAVRMASKTDILDAPSGFRAISRAAAERLMVFNNYTYTLETIIQAGQRNMAVTSVPVRVNEDLRPSRLLKSAPAYVGGASAPSCASSSSTGPSASSPPSAAVLFGVGFLLGLRFLVYYLLGEGGGHVQSLILASVLLSMGFQTLLVAFLADLLAANRQLLEEVRYRTRAWSRRP